ncbi:MAG: hypothetical protein ACRC0F_06025 [Cetobacterium sp.]
MNNRNEVLLEIIREEVKRDVISEIEATKKEEAKKNVLFEQFQGNTYVNIDVF